MPINWECFFENTSTREALFDFANQGGFKQLKENCWPKECKKEVSKLQKLGIQEARKRAKVALFQKFYK